MKNPTKPVLFALTALLLFASLLQMRFHWVDFKPLNGAVNDQPLPKISFAGFKDTGYQQQVEQYLKLHFGFREPLIRFYNQYLWDFYKKTPVSENQVVMGKEGWMYGPWSVTDHYQRQYLCYAKDTAEMAQKLASEARRVLQVQQILEANGTHLFVCLTPTKDHIYPEYLPEDPKPELSEVPKFTAREFYQREYAKMGINFLDLDQYFLSMKDTADFLLFPVTGEHWANYASLFAADTLIRYMEHLGDINMHNVVIGPRTLGDARDPDDDFEQLMNLMRPMPKSRYYYANATPDDDTTAVKPKIIVIGDSFWWNIATQLPVRDFFSAVPYWYYFYSVHYDSPHKTVNDLDIKEELLSADFVVIFYCATTLYRMNDGFSIDALEALCDPSEYSLDSAAYIERQIQRTINDILTTPNWAESVRQKAIRRHKDFEQAVRDDAEWLVEQKIKDGTFEWPTNKQD